jgi:DNA-binding NarL/FixJ family response regulator
MPDLDAAADAPIRVLIVDVDRRVRASLQGLLSACDEIRVVGSAADVESARRLCDSALPDVVVLDPRLPDVDSGMALLRALRECWPQVGVVAMSASAAMEIPALATGALSFVAKAGQTGDLIAAVQAVGKRTKRATNAAPPVADAASSAASTPPISTAPALGALRPLADPSL